jgi:hypothetical protein
VSQQVQVQAEGQKKQKNTRMARRLLWVAGFSNIAGFVLWLPMASSGTGGLVFMLLLGLVANSVAAVYAIQNGLVFELLIEHKWKKVCRGIGDNFVGVGRLQFHPGISYDFYGAFKKGRWERKTIYPKIRDVVGTFDSWTGVIYPFYGQNLTDFSSQADRIAMAFSVPYVTCELNERGLIAIRAGNVPVPSVYDFQDF